MWCNISSFTVLFLRKYSLNIFNSELFPRTRIRQIFKFDFLEAKASKEKMLLRTFDVFFHVELHRTRLCNRL